jgi:threonine/homoserine/homoserine lactone efflux protein
MELQTWLAFFAACWVISLSPGAGAIASMSSGLQYGFWRGYWNALGLQLGLAVQIAIVGAGVGAILTASASAFYAIKWFGVAYLVYLAIKQWRALPSDMSDDAAVRQIGKPMALVFRGFLVNISNRRDHDLRRPDRHGRLHRAGVQGAAPIAHTPAAKTHEPHVCRAVYWRSGIYGDAA